MTEPTAVIDDRSRWDHRRTERLVLDHVHVDDVDDWHRIHADPRVWTHFPSGLHTSRDATAEFVEASIEDWRVAGLGYWSIREEIGGPVIGCGGCRLLPDQHRWNLYYRFSPESQGRGYAAEVARAAIAAANEVDPDVPVVAFMLEHNVASWRVAEKVGLVRVWVGPDEGNPDPDAIRYVYADRPDVVL
ncbi:MAG: GNAT family N-acetyltransferase [Actinomycetota bacterium]